MVISNREKNTCGADDVSVHHRRAHAFLRSYQGIYYSHARLS